MSKTELKIQLYDSPILRKKCKKVKSIDFQVSQLLDKMVYLMRKEKGVGLAGNQASLNLSLVVIETSPKLYKLINPRLTKRKGRIIFDEGCLSFPGLTLSVKRAEEVWVNYLDTQGKSIDLKAEGTLAVILQHEIDHSEGILFIDRVSFLKRLEIRRNLENIKRLYKKSLVGK